METYNRWWANGISNEYRNEYEMQTYMFQWMLVELIKCDTREEAEETFYALAKIFKVEDIVKL